MTQERIEADLRRSARRRGVGVFDAVDLRRELERPRVVGFSAIDSRHRCNRALDARAPFGGFRLACPVAAQHELFDRLLPQVILLAHWEKESRRERGGVDGAEDERCVAEAAELLT